MAKPAKGKTRRARHRELLVQMQINRGNATAGGSGANVPASALMSVLVTLNGEPVADLGASAGNQTSAINLPAAGRCGTVSTCGREAAERPSPSS